MTVMTTPFKNGDRLGCGEEGSRLGPAVVETWGQNCNAAAPQRVLSDRRRPEAGTLNPGRCPWLKSRRTQARQVIKRCPDKSLEGYGFRPAGRSPWQASRQQATGGWSRRISEIQPQERGCVQMCRCWGDGGSSLWAAGCREASWSLAAAGFRWTKTGSNSIRIDERERIKKPGPL